MKKTHQEMLRLYNVARPGKTRRDKVSGSWLPPLARKQRAQQKSAEDMKRRGKLL